MRLCVRRPGRQHLGVNARGKNFAISVWLAGALLLVAGALTPTPSVSEPKGLETMRALALELLKVQDYEGSIEVYREITRHTPGDPKSHYDLAGALSFIKLYDEAVEPIQTSIRLDPGNVRAHEMAALIFLNLKRYEEAFVATLKSAELGEITAMYSLVNMYEQGLGTEADQDKAIYWAQRAAEHGHQGAIAIMEEAYRTGRFAREIDLATADVWAKRLRDAE